MGKMQQNKYDYLKTIDLDSLVEFSYTTKLLKPKRYFTKQDFAKGLSRKLSLEQCKLITEAYENKTPISSIANKFLVELNSNARIVREMFVNYMFYNQIKQITNDVIFFEYKVGNSRTDINRVNQYSYAFEIKSARDNQSRAIYQTTEFSDVFDFVTLIVSNEEEYEHISDNVGIIKYEYIDGEMHFESMRKPKRNLELDYMKQLNSLSKEELITILGVKTTEPDKQILINEILGSFTEPEINTNFKSCLKNKFYDKWNEYLNRFILNS